MSQADYYDNPDDWGNYQYITLEEVINNYMMSMSSDDLTSTTPRHKILYQARRGFRELHYDVLREVRAIELELPPSLTITLPPDFVNYVRISWVTEDGILVPMVTNNSMSIASRYLQDHEYNILFDDSGCVLEDNHVVDPATVEVSNTVSNRDCNYYKFSHRSFQPNRNMSNNYPNGFYKVDKNAGVIYFSSDAFGKKIVLEYISDGLYKGCSIEDEEKVRIHKLAEQALLDFIHHELIKNRAHVPYNEKIRARKEWFNSKSRARRRLKGLRKSELIHSMLGSSKWIK